MGKAKFLTKLLLVIGPAGLNKIKFLGSSNKYHNHHFPRTSLILFEKEKRP
jgi:hypothetical protein